jgi:hypothetical protein
MPEALRPGHPLIDRQQLADGWRNDWPHLRQAMQTAIAACGAYAIAELMHMPQGFWAVVTAITVMQANVGASLGQALDRLVGSLVGVLAGGAVAALLTDAHLLKYAGLAATVLVLAYFSATRPPLRIACVTAAIVVLGDPRFGAPISSAGNRMIEVMIGASVASLTSLLVFPSRAGTALADHVRRSLPLYIELLSDMLSAALGRRYDADAAGVVAAKIRSSITRTEALARETKVELAGYLAEYPDTDAIVRTVRRLWHTEVMLMRAVASPLPQSAVAVMRSPLERLQAAIGRLSVSYAGGEAGADRTQEALSDAETALAAAESELAEFRARGALRQLPMEDVMRLMTFDFALGQLGTNLKDLSDRSADLAGLTASSMPLVRRARALLTSRLG